VNSPGEMRIDWIVESRIAVDILEFLSRMFVEFNYRPEKGSVHVVPEISYVTSAVPIKPFESGPPNVILDGYIF
jgi:hypothetical protein